MPAVAELVLEPLFTLHPWPDPVLPLIVSYRTTKKFVCCSCPGVARLFFSELRVVSSSNSKSNDYERNRHDPKCKRLWRVRSSSGCWGRVRCLVHAASLVYLPSNCRYSPSSMISWFWPLAASSTALRSFEDMPSFQLLLSDDATPGLRARGVD